MNSLFLSKLFETARRAVSGGTAPNKALLTRVQRAVEQSRNRGDLATAIEAKRLAQALSRLVK